MANGIVLRVTHLQRALSSPPFPAGSTVDTSLLINDVTDPRDLQQKPVYVTVGTPVDLLYTHLVAQSYEDGAIRGFIDSGDLSAEFLLGDGAKQALRPSFETVAVSPLNVANTTTFVVSDPTAAAPVLVNLPPGDNHATQTITIKDFKGDAGTNSITINPDGAETIEGGANYSITTDNDSVTLVYNADENDWMVAPVTTTAPVNRTTYVAVGTGAPGTLSGGMSAANPTYDSGESEAYVRVSAAGGTETGAWYWTFVIPDTFNAPAGDGFTFKYRISNNAGSNTVQIGIDQNGGEVLLDVAGNPSGTTVETYTVTPAELTAEPVSFTPGDVVSGKILISLEDTETLDLFGMTFEHTITG